jgi:hypothetical protein
MVERPAAVRSAAATISAKVDMVICFLDGAFDCYCLRDGFRSRVEVVCGEVVKIKFQESRRGFKAASAHGPSP